MLPAQIIHRNELLARNTALLEQHPQRMGQQFFNEMIAIAESLQLLAKEVDDASDNRLERSRNWRFVGNAYIDITDATREPFLKLAIDAFNKSEFLLSGFDNPEEQMKLNYCLGNAIFLQSEGKVLHLMNAAKTRFTGALETASLVMPSVVNGIKETLVKVDKMIALQGLSDNTDQRFNEISEKINRYAGRDRRSANDGKEFQSVIAELMNVYNKEIIAGKVSDTRQQVLTPVLSDLEDIAKMHSAKDIESPLIRSRIGDVARRLQHVLSDTSHGTPPLAINSRAGKVWELFKQFKLFISEELMRSHAGNDDKMYGLEIFRRCSHADTYLHKPVLKDEAIVNYESDYLRQLANEVRTYSLREHLTLISPVWKAAAYPANPNEIFFSGKDTLKNMLTEICKVNKLNATSKPISSDYASSRWRQISSCHVAIFDFTHYKPQSVIIQATPDSESQIAIFEASYELGIALTIGKPVVVLAIEGQNLFFDIDIVPVLLKNDESDFDRISTAIDNVMYTRQRGKDKSSIKATQEYLKLKYSNESDVIITHSLKLINDLGTLDPVRFRRLVEPILGTLGTSAPQIAYPSWPGDYPQTSPRLCFHVMPFAPNWADKAMTTVAAACNLAYPATVYIRGDLAKEANIIKSIWENLCKASHIVVDLTGLNANVALELGIAHTLGRNVLLVTQDTDKLYQYLAISKMRIKTYAAGETGLKILRKEVDEFLLSD